MRRIDLAGDHYTMGKQHGQQIQDLRPHLAEVIYRRLAVLDECDLDLAPLINEILEVWEEHAQGTLDMLRGIAALLEIDWRTYLRYTLAAYLEDLAHCGNGQEGCSTWAAGPPITPDGSLLLVKNRDYRPDHLDLQCVAFAQPLTGYGYAYITSAGTPGVFSSGMNEAGLAVADTHVNSLDVGPGVARYSLMMTILEEHGSVSSAVDFLLSVPHTGNGTLILLDKTGDMAVFEITHHTQAIIQPKNGFVISTNHYRSEQLKDKWEDRSLPALRGNSQGRSKRIEASLRGANGSVDAAWAQRLMSDHGDPLDAICRHPGLDPNSMTISSVQYLPHAGRISLAHGHPCLVDVFSQYSI
jgi:hypothetical protein